MSNHKDKDHENIFEILDGMMFQLSRTKKMFMIMILSVLILPPATILVMTSVAEPSFQQQFEERLQERLASGDISQEEYDEIKQKVGKGKPNRLHPPQLVIFVISIVWLGIGIRQWIVLSKWDKKYQQFKVRQEEIDKKFEDDSDEEKRD